MFTQRGAFDCGGTVMIFPMHELPYWRVVMARERENPRWQPFAAEHTHALEFVRRAFAERGPLASRDIEGKNDRPGNFRSGKDTGRAIYYLWRIGELMTHSRRKGDRVYDLWERVAPSEVRHEVSPQESDAYLALKTFRQWGIVTEKSWRSWFTAQRIPQDIARQRLDQLLAAGQIIPIQLEDDPKDRRYIAAEDLPLLESLQRGHIPDAWRPLDTTTTDEMIFLAPLDMVSARGRALPIFDFEYIWEVYKPQHLRRWGYYTLPVLYGDKLVARFDPKLDRKTNTLHIQGFWVEAGIRMDEAFDAALIAGLKTFMRFVGAQTLSLDRGMPDPIRSVLAALKP